MWSGENSGLRIQPSLNPGSYTNWLNAEPVFSSVNGDNEYYYILQNDEDSSL